MFILIGHEQDSAVIQNQAKLPLKRKRLQEKVRRDTKKNETSAISNELTFN